MGVIITEFRDSDLLSEVYNDRANMAGGWVKEFRDKFSRFQFHTIP